LGGKKGDASPMVDVLIGILAAAGFIAGISWCFSGDEDDKR